MSDATRALTDEELDWIAQSATELLRRQPEATGHAGFDDPPDGWLRELRAARP